MELYAAVQRGLKDLSVTVIGSSDSPFSCYTFLLSSGIKQKTTVCFAMKWHTHLESDLVVLLCEAACTKTETWSQAAGVCVIVCVQGPVHSILPGPAQSVLSGSVEDTLSDRETEIQNGCHPRSCRWSEGKLGQ